MNSTYGILFGKQFQNVNFLTTLTWPEARHVEIELKLHEDENWRSWYTCIIHVSTKKPHTRSNEIVTLSHSRNCQMVSQVVSHVALVLYVDTVWKRAWLSPQMKNTDACHLESEIFAAVTHQTCLRRNKITEPKSLKDKLVEEKIATPCIIWSVRNSPPSGSAKHQQTQVSMSWWCRRLLQQRRLNWTRYLACSLINSDWMWIAFMGECVSRN